MEEDCLRLLSGYKNPPTQDFDVELLHNWRTAGVQVTRATSFKVWLLLRHADGDPGRRPGGGRLVAWK